MSDQTRIIYPSDPSYEAHLAVDRRIELALRPYRHLPGVQRHFALVERLQRELAAREDAAPGAREE